MLRQRWIRFGSYPSVRLPALLLGAAVAGDTAAAWPPLVLVSAVGISCVALLERLQPVERDWLPLRTTPSRRDAAFAQRLADGYAALHTGQTERAHALFEKAHVLGQAHTRSHVRSHWAFPRWSLRVADRREAAGQVPRLLAAALFTGLWVPIGNTGSARIGAFRKPPIPLSLQTYFEDTAR